MAARPSFSDSLQGSLQASLQSSVAFRSGRYHGGKEAVHEGFERSTKSTKSTNNAYKKDSSLSRVTCCLLSAASFGPESSVSYQFIYGILSLQYLGVPVYLVSMDGLVVGLGSMFLIPALGSFADRGADPKKRKMWLLLVSISFFTLSYLLLGIASGVKANSLKMDLIRAHHGNKSSENSTNGTSGQTGTELTATSAETLTITGFIGIISSICLESGYDSSMSQIRTFLLDNVPDHQNGQILATSTIMTSLGGLVIAFFGIFDMPSILGPLLGMDGVPAMLIFISIYLSGTTLLTYCITFSTYFWLSRKRTQSDDRSGEYLLSTERSLGKDLDSKKTRKSGNEENSSNLNVPRTTKARVEQDYSNDGIVYDNETALLSIVPNTNLNYKTTENNNSREEVVIKVKATTNSSGLRHTARDPSKRFSFITEWAFILDKRLLLVLFITFCSYGCLLVVAVYISNTLIIEVVKGDPRALPGTEGMVRYKEGLRYSSSGLLVAYVSILGTSICTNKLLSIIGPKMLLLLVNIAMLASIVTFYLVHNLAIFYFLMVVYGVYKSLTYTITFLLATTYARKKDNDYSAPDDVKNRNLGKVMSLIGILISMNYLFMSSFMGPVMDATNSAWPPMFLLMAYTSLAVPAALWLLFLK